MHCSIPYYIVRVYCRKERIMVIIDYKKNQESEGTKKCFNSC